MICRDIDVATRVARTDGLDCITLEGWHVYFFLSFAPGRLKLASLM